MPGSQHHCARDLAGPNCCSNRTIYGLQSGLKQSGSLRTGLCQSSEGRLGRESEHSGMRDDSRENQPG